MAVSLAHLRAVSAVATTMSFTRAGEHLGLAQPTISMQVRAFEESCRTKVFLRRGQSLELTPFGREILPKIRHVLLLLGDLERSIEQRATTKRGELSVGFSAYRFFMPILSRYMATYPEVKVRAGGGASQALLDDLSDLKLDAAMVTSRGPVRGFESELIFSKRVIVYCNRDHPFAVHDTVSLQHLAGQAFVHREPSSNTRAIFDAALDAEGIETHVRLELASWEAAFAAVAQGIGLGIALEDELPEWEPVKRIALNAPDLAVGQHLVTLQDYRELAPVAALFEVAKAVGDADAASSSPSV